MIYVLAFLMNFITGMVIFSFPMTAIEVFDAGTVSLGVLGMAGAGFYALVCLFSGRAADRFGSRRVIRFSCAFLLAVYLSIFLVVDFWHLIALSMLFSLGAGHFWPAMMKWVGESDEGDVLQARIGFYNISWSTGIMLGPFAAGTLFAVDYRYPYLLAAVVLTIMLVLHIRVRRKAPAAATPSGPASTAAEPPSAAAELFLGLAYLANFSSWFSIGASQALFPRLAVEISISPQRLGLLMALIGLANLAMFVFLSRTRRWHYDYRWLAVFQLLSLTGMGLLATAARTALFGIGFFLLGACAGMTYFSSLFYSLHGRSGKGRSSGYHEAILGMGVAFGPLAGGIAARWSGLRAPYFLCGAVIILFLALQAVRLRRGASARKEQAAVLSGDGK